MSKRSLISVFFLGIMLVLSVTVIVTSFGKVKERYKEIEPNLDNYSTSEVLLLSFERMKTTLLKSDGKDLEEFLLSKAIFESKIKILYDKSSYSKAFSHDVEFVNVRNHISSKEVKLSVLTNRFKEGWVGKEILLEFMDDMDSDLLDLQEIIFNIHIRNFNEVKEIIKDNSAKAEGLTIVSLLLFFIMIGIVLKSSYSLKRIIKEKNIFISSIYHELASSTQKIIIAADIIEHELTGEAFKKEAGIISFHASKILDQTRDVMDFSRFEMGSFIIRTSIFNVNDLVNDAINDVFKGGGNHIRFLTSPNNKYVKTDRYKLYRIIINLLDNANKNTHSGVVIINCRISGRGLYLLVKDTGVGFNLKIIKELYKAFNQGAERETKQGLGLGLTIIKNYVEALKGSIRVKSEVGKGSSFLVFIPTELIEEQI